MLIDLVTNAKVFRPCQTIYWWLSAYATDCGSQIRRDSTECVHTVHWAAATAKATRKMDCEDGNVASKLTLTVFGAMSLITAGMAAMAQETPSYMGGVSTGMAAGCRTTQWHIRPVPPTGATPIVGVAYFSDMSGISKIDGMRTAEGKISGTLISISGKGPTGQFTGTRTPTMTHVQLNGPGCSRHVVNIDRMPVNYGC